MPIEGMNDTSIILLVALLVLGGGFIVAMLCIIKRSNTNHQLPITNHSPDGAWWLAGILTGLLMLVTFGWLDASDERARYADAAVKKTTGGGAVSLANCPPPGPGLTDTVVMVITSQADKQPAVTRCSRIAERPYKQRRRLIVTAEPQ